MIDRRRKAKPARPKTRAVSSSGPRCARAAAMRPKDVAVGRGARREDEAGYAAHDAIAPR